MGRLKVVGGTVEVEGRLAVDAIAVEQGTIAGGKIIALTRAVGPGAHGGSVVGGYGAGVQPEGEGGGAVGGADAGGTGLGNCGQASGQEGQDVKRLHGEQVFS